MPERSKPSDATLSSAIARRLTSSTVFRTYYGPIVKALAALDKDRRHSLVADLEALSARLNRADDGTMVVPGEYLEAVIVGR